MVSDDPGAGNPRLRGAHIEGLNPRKVGMDQVVWHTAQGSGAVREDGDEYVPTRLSCDHQKHGGQPFLLIPDA